MTNKTNKVLYVGVTNDLKRRISEHTKGQIEGFTKRYNLHKLVYFEEFLEIIDAIKREKQLKHWSRSKKNLLIADFNPKWDDLGNVVLKRN